MISMDPSPFHFIHEPPNNDDPSPASPTAKGPQNKPSPCLLYDSSPSQEHFLPASRKPRLPLPALLLLATSNLARQALPSPSGMLFVSVQLLDIGPSGAPVPPPSDLPGH
ncbi:hypothetical protein V2G26_000521 [Clonostachys chloroleuca]